MAASDYINEVQGYYLAYYGRFADQAGLAFWTAKLDEVGGDATAIIDEFGNSAEADTLFGSLDTAGKINFLYNSLFNRDADAGGLAFYTARIDSGEATVASIAKQILDGATGLDAIAVNNKITVANSLTETTLPASYSGTDAASAARAVMETVTATNATPTVNYADALAATTNGTTTVTAETFTLTTGIDTVSGGTGNDTIVAFIDANTTADSTLTALDSIDGGAGTDSLTFNVIDADLAAMPAGTTISNVETMNIRATHDLGTVGINDLVNDGADDDNATPSAAFDLSGVSGLTTANITQVVDASILAATTTDVNVSGATGNIEVDGGKTVSVTDSTANNNITVGSNVAAAADDTNTAGTAATGTVTVTDSNQGTGVILVDGGTDVSVTATSSATGALTTGTITVGSLDTASGTSTVTQNVTSDASAAVTAGNVAVTGGTAIDITANITTNAANAANTVVTAGTYTATADANTTDVTITQNVTANDFAKNVTTAATTETAVVTFGALAAGESVSISAAANSADNTDLAFIATSAMTAAEVAAAFASLTAADTQAAGGVVSNGYFIGDLDGGWTSGAASGATVTFSATTVGAKAADITVSTDATGDYSSADNAAADADFSVSVTNGVNEVAQAAVDITGDYGNVVVDDNGGTASITTVTLDGGFDDATIGAGGTMDALANLSLTGGQGDVLITSAVTSMNVSMDGMAAGSTYTDAGLTTLNLTTTGSASDVDFTLAAATTVNVTAGANLDVSGGTFAAVTGLTITGAGDVTLGSIAGTATSVDASGSTGDISVTIGGDTATYTGSAGADTVTSDSAVTKAISLGAGDDTFTMLADNTAVPTATLAGGEGTDVLSMSGVSAAAYDDNTNLATAISGFERLTINDRIDVTGGVDIDTEALGFANYVTLSGTTDGTNDTGVTADGDNLTLSNMASGATVVLTDTQTSTSGDALDIPTTIVAVKDAATGTADSLNVVVDNIDGGGDVDAGTLTADDVETISIAINDGDNDTGIDDHTLTLDADSVTAITVGTADGTAVDANGNQDLTTFALTVTNATALETVDASAMLGTFTYTADDGKTTVTGGSGNDALTASGFEDTLIGGAGNDTLTGTKLTSLTGGEGNDIFTVTAGAQATEFSYITDFSAGDVIDLTDGNTFVSDKFTQIGATLSNYVDAAVNNTSAGETSWFNLTVDGTDYTYIVDNQSGGTTFDQTQDLVIAIVGTVDLSQANYNQTDGTLEIA